MRLRTVPLLLVIVAIVAALGAWTDDLKVQTKAPPVVLATKPWNAIVRVTRRGRGIDGYAAVVTLTGPRGSQQIVMARVRDQVRARGASELLLNVGAV